MVSLVAVTESTDQPSVLTPWSLVHFSAGIVAHLFLRKCGFGLYEQAVTWFAAGMIYESKDVYYSYVSANKLTGALSDSFVNSMGDIGCNMAGFAVGVWLLPKTTSVQTDLIVFVLLAVLIALFYSLD